VAAVVFWFPTYDGNSVHDYQKCYGKGNKCQIATLNGQVSQSNDPSQLHFHVKNVAQRHLSNYWNK